MSRPGSRLSLALLVLAIVITGCGKAGTGGTTPGSASETTSPSNQDPKLAAMVPTDISHDNMLTIVTGDSFAPNEFTQNGQTVGMDVDMATAISQVLGLTPQFTTAGSDTDALTDVTSGKYELALSSFTITSSRLQQADMVSYFTAGTALATLKGNPKGVTLDDMCGHTIAVQQGTPQADDLTARSAACQMNGNLAITPLPQPTEDAAQQAVLGKQADGLLADSPVVAYAVKQTGQLDQVGATYAKAPYGIVLAHNRGQFAQAVQGAVQDLIANGTYRQILDRWGLGSGAVTTSEVDPQPAS